MAVLVLQIVADDDFPNLGFGPMTLRPAFQVIENVELNRDTNGTHKSARKVARRIRDVVKVCGMQGLVASIQTDKPCIEPVNLGEEMGKLLKGYQVNFKCFEIPDKNMSQVQTPVFRSLMPAGTSPGSSSAAFQVVIDCATPEATIFYTLDDSYPREGNPQAHVYADPIDVPVSGFILRACGYGAGMIASWVNRAEIVVQ